MENNDLTGKYLSVRESGNLTPAQKFRAQKESEANIAGSQKSPGVIDIGGVVDTVSGVIDTGMDVAQDVGLGIVEAPRQILGGFLDATAEMAKFMNEIVPLQDDPEYLSADEARSVTGGGVRTISQFLTGFLPAMKATRAIQLGRTAPYAAGAVADAAAFDGHESRLSDLVQEYPELQNPVTEYLASDQDDSQAEGRMKNAIEGLALGGMTDAVFQGVKALRGWRLDKKAAETASVDDVADDVISGNLEGEFIPFETTVGNPDGKRFSQGGTEAADDRALNINFARLNTTDDVGQLIDGVAKADAKGINAERRNVISHAETEKLADELGMSVDDLLSRRQGESFNAEQAVAARKILVSSGEHLMGLANVARTGDEMQLAQFRRALAQHKAIQAQVSGMTAEAGRALGSFNIIASSAREQERAIREALETSGGMGETKNLADMISKLEGTHQINTALKQSFMRNAADITYEAWINGLLSSPATHAVNVIGNSITTVWSVGERKVASLISQVAGDDAIPQGESTAMLYGMVKGAKDGLKLAWDALKTGEPSDAITKIETQHRKAISSETFGLSGVPGMAADFLGEVVRTPGRFLTAGDELFKSMGYRMELHSQAFRQASGEGLKDDAMARRMEEIIQNPPENIKMDAVDFSRYITYTKELGESGKAFQSFVSKTPGARIIVPFIRTPTNIMKYVGERTVLAPLAKSVREEIIAGGARRDTALAKIATGSLVMAAAADWAASGDITGKGPVNRQMSNMMRATGWQPYSIKVGDTYYAYNRLDPIGATIGLAADMAEIIGQVGEADAMDLAIAAGVAVGQNVTSKTYLSGVSEFFDVMSSTSSDPEANNKKMQRWLTRMAGSTIPAGVAQVERTLNPELSATQGIVEKIKSRIPGYSDDLPPRRNIFGEPIVLSGGLGPDIMSPIYTSTDKKDPVADEIVSQQALVRMPRNNINGVELNSKQYDDYINLYAGKNNPMVERPLKTALRMLFRSSIYRNATDGPEGGKSSLITTTFNGYRDAAKAEMLKRNPDIQATIMKAKVKRAEKLTGETLQTMTQ